jgi:hypothetical protein
MLNWNDLKNLDVKDFDLTRIDLTRLDVRNLGLPKFEMPTVEMPKFGMPSFEVPAVELPDFPVDIDRVAGLARDAAYAGVGAAVVTAKKLDEQRRELTDQVTAQVRKLVDAVV